jgi:hypothetical protein
MSDGMSDGRDYGPSLSKHSPPVISKDGKPVEFQKCDQRMLACSNPIYCVKDRGHSGEHSDCVGIHWT